MLPNPTATKLLLFLCAILPALGVVYKATDIFYSQLCVLPYTGNWNIGGSNTCTTAVAQTGVVRVGIVMAQNSKAVGNYHDFSASVSPPAVDPVSSFTIIVSTNLPTGSSMRTSFFLVVIKSQPIDKMIDFAQFSWIADPLVDNANTGDRTTSSTIDITTLPSAVFTSGTNVIPTPFVTCFSMSPPLVNGSSDATSVMEYFLTTSMSGNSVTIVLTAKSFTKISALKGIVILANPTTISSVASAKTWNMSLTNRTFSAGGILNLTTNSAIFGPNFNSKCIFGLHRMQYQGSFRIDYYFTNTSLGHYESYHFDTDQSPQADGCFLCFGNSSECGDAEAYWDFLNNQCYQASTCPLPVFTGWTQTTLCPNCSQLICLDCTAANRSNCLTCGLNADLASGTCTCKAGFWPFNTAISTSALGQWNNQANSLTECRPNCTNTFAGCQWDQCTATACTACLAGYIMKTDASGNNYCKLCRDIFIYCTECSTWSGFDYCSLCDPGYYWSWSWSSSKCDLCSNKSPGCGTCAQTWGGFSCSACLPGYIADTSSGSLKCTCNTTNLPNCLVCASLTTCTTCVAGFYLNPTDKLCYPCTLIHLACLTCSAPNMCTSCSQNYIPSTTPSGDTCVLCNTVINNCTSCSSTTVCTNCDQFFGLNSAFQCQKCIQLINSCLDCENPISCLTCISGFYLATDPVTLNQICLSCLTLMPNCQTCTPNQCLSCVSPYLLAPDGTCTACIYGYEFRGGVCTNLPGCSSSVKLSNGTEICIACDQSLHFYFNTTLLKCVCIQGFKEFYQAGLLPVCLPICGDGIILQGFENCDDLNAISGDGCDSTCHTEPGFDCGTLQPSQCILYLNFQIVTFNYVSRVIGQNAGILSFTILPAHAGLEKMAWSKLIKFNFSSTAVDPSQLKFSYSSSTAELQVTVPYMQELENSELTSTITLDPKYVVSATPTFILQNKLNGVNAPLMFQPEALLSTQKSINTISLIMMILLLIQFYVGSYFHKMIGLETIQVIQSIYFVRMVATSKETSLLTSMNLVQYSASGYQNSELLFGSSVHEIQQNSSDSIDPQFLSIGMYKNFLMNANISLFPLMVIAIVYIVSLARKYRKRNEFIETQQQQSKDRYTSLRRSSQWVYDHFVFPFIMMFNSISFFNVILQLSYSPNPQTPTQPTSSIQFQSSIALSSILFATIAIYCYEVFYSYREYARFTMTQRQRDRVPMSVVEKLQHDENNADRANYHPLYVFVYLLYYLLLCLIMVLEVLVSGFRYSLEMVMGLSICYFVLICCWKPYHSSINVHNHFLKLYYGTFVLFTVICYLFSKVNKLETGVYVSLMYIVMGLLMCILIGGFVRIFFERKYRKELQENSSILEWKKFDEQLDKKLKQYEKNPLQVQNKKQTLLSKNQYAFKNQLKQIKKKFSSNTPIMIPGIQDHNSDSLHPKEEEKIVEKIKYDIQKRRESIDIENWKEEMKRKHSNDSVDQSKLLNETTDKDVTLGLSFRKSPSPNQSPTKREQPANIKKADNELLKEIKMKLRSQHAIS